MSARHEIEAAPASGGLRGLVRRHAGLLTAASISLAWVLLTLNRPDTTYHLAPFLVAGSWGAARRWTAAGPGSRRDGFAAAGGGLVVALVTTVELAWLGALNGPTFWGSSDALAETVGLAVLGAALGFRFVTRRRPGFLFPA